MSNFVLINVPTFLEYMFGTIKQDWGPRGNFFLNTLIVNFNWVVFAICGLLLVIIPFCYSAFIVNAMRKSKIYPHAEPKTKFAILIPARNESKVITNILNTCKAQDYPANLFDVYVIVETEDDPTVQIVESFGYKIVVRGDLEGRRTKGFALDDAYQHIKKSNIHYDAFMVFDADNLLNPDFLSKMNDCRAQGYKVSVGYRNYTNASVNWITSCSATLFSYINGVTNKGRSTFFQKGTLTGTGYYIDSDIVDDVGGWIWTGMTEDIDLSYYCYQANIKFHYYPAAMYYDEECTTFKEVHKQHVRWVWGFFSSKKKYKKYNFDYHSTESKLKKVVSLVEFRTSIIPFACFIIIETIVALMQFLIASSSVVFCPEVSWIIYLSSLYHFLAAYILFTFVGLLTLIIDNHHLKLSWKSKIVTFFMYFFFYADFGLAFIDGFFHKDKRTNWKRIEHKGEIIDKKAKEVHKE